jgi:hypothetical protein
MPVTFQNRKGAVYYLHEGTTKTGKPRYFFSREQSGPLVDEIPPGFEITESVNGIVSLRRAGPPLISDEEVQLVRTALDQVPRLRHYQVGRQRNALLIYEPSSVWEPDDPFILRLAKNGSASDLAERLREYSEQYGQYTAVMKFTLVDRQARSFEAHRMCYRSSVDGWLSLDEGDLRTLVRRYVKHLGQDSFYELY